MAEVMTRDKYVMLQQRHKANAMSISKNGYRVVLTPHFEKNSSMTETELETIDRLNEPIEFDYVESTSVQTNSTITSYPIVNGDSVADHMWRQPVTVSISGKFSIYGNKPTTFFGADDRLTNIEKFFERIKDEGIMCDIVTMQRANSNAKQRFKSRHNMALTGISWTESQASVSFQLTFTEALTVNLDEIEVDYADENLPDITDASNLDFTDTLLDWNKIDQLVVMKLYELDLMTEGFWNQFTSWAKTYGEAVINGVIGSAVGLAAGLVVGAFASAIPGILAALGVIATVPVAGWTVALVGAAIGAIVGAIWAFIDTFKRAKAEQEFGIQQFKAYEDDRQNQQECERFLNYIGNIHLQLEYLEDVMQVYGISSNTEQDCMLYIDNNYYVFSFRKNNTQTSDGKVTWSCNITDANETVNVDVPDIAGAALSSIDQCTSSNMLFRTQTGGGYWIYILNNKMLEVQNATYSTDAELAEKERQEAVNACNSDLTSFIIFVSQTNMDDFNDKLADIVVNAMKM